MTYEELVEKLQQVRDLLIAKSRWAESGEDHHTYASLRAELLDVPDLKPALPPYVRSCRGLPDFWNYLKNEHPDLKTYKSRADFIWAGFKLLIASLVNSDTVGGEAFVSEGFGPRRLYAYPRDPATGQGCHYRYALNSRVRVFFVKIALHTAFGGSVGRGGWRRRSLPCRTGAREAYGPP